jgi:hypothetical protein
LTQTVVVESLRDLHKLLNAPNIHVKNLVDGLGDKMLVSYKPLYDELTDSPNVNLVLALLTTAYGRIILYKLLAHAGRKAKYADTGM